MRKRYLFLSLAVIIIITGVLVWACKDPTGPGIIERQKDGVAGVDGASGNNNYTLTNGQLFSSVYKIPALTVSTNNVIIAAAGVSSGSQQVSVKKSSDNGTNWSEVTNLDANYSYPFFINCHNGDILLGVTTTAASKDSKTIFYKSSDSGATWNKESKDISISSIAVTATNGSATYGQGIALRHGGNENSKKIMFPYLYNAPDNQNKKDGYYVAIMYSEDGGSSFNSICENFTNSYAPPYTAGNIGSFGSYHPQLLELANGDILLNIRCLNNKGMMLWLLSKDCGKNWDIPTFVDAPENKNGGVWAKHADFIRYEFNGKDIKNGSDKHALMICSYENKAGYDIMMTENDFNNGDEAGGTNKKYASTKNLESSTKGGYPAITVLSNGTIATLTEESSGIVFKTHFYDGSKLN